MQSINVGVGQHILNQITESTEKSPKARNRILTQHEVSEWLQRMRKGDLERQVKEVGQYKERC